MKIIKLLFVFAIVSLIAVSCKETKKEEVKEAIEQTEEVSTEVKSDVKSDVESSEVTHEEVKTKSKSSEKSIETKTVGIEEGLDLEESAETPVIYPGCEGTHEEIRACSRKKFKKFIVSNFDKGLSSDLKLQEGSHRVRAIVKISATGKASVIRVDSPEESLQKEVVRLINKLPIMTAATNGGKPIDVYFVLPVNFKIKD